MNRTGASSLFQKNIHWKFISIKSRNYREIWVVLLVLLENLGFNEGDLKIKKLKNIKEPKKKPKVQQEILNFE
jgi:hypothetical protein